ADDVVVRVGAAGRPAGARGDALLRVGGDVVAAGGGGLAVGERAGHAGEAAVGEEVRGGDHRRRPRVPQRHLDDGDQVVRRPAVGEGRVRAVRGDVEVDVLAAAVGDER